MVRPSDLVSPWWCRFSGWSLGRSARSGSGRFCPSGPGIRGMPVGRSIWAGNQWRRVARCLDHRMVRA